MLINILVALAITSSVVVLAHVFGTMSGFGRTARAKLIKDAFRARPLRAARRIAKAKPELSPESSGRW